MDRPKMKRRRIKSIQITTKIISVVDTVYKFNLPTDPIAILHQNNVSSPIKRILIHKVIQMRNQSG